MKKTKLTLGRETIRKLTGRELQAAVGGSDPITGPIDLCQPASPYNTCTGCGIGSMEPCGTGWCGPSGTGQSDMTCTLVGNTKDGGG